MNITFKSLIKYTKNYHNYYFLSEFLQKYYHNSRFNVVTKIPIVYITYSYEVDLDLSSGTNNLIHEFHMVI